MLAVDPKGKQDLIMVASKSNGSTHRRSKRFGGRGHPRISSKAIPKNKPTGGSQPPILGASESLTLPELGPGGFQYIHCEEWPKHFPADRAPSVEFERKEKLGFQARRFLKVLMVC